VQQQVFRCLKDRRHIFFGERDLFAVLFRVGRSVVDGSGSKELRTLIAKDVNDLPRNDASPVLFYNDLPAKIWY
jgi:hypothetical protein